MLMVGAEHSLLMSRQLSKQLILLLDTMEGIFIIRLEPVHGTTMRNCPSMKLGCMIATMLKPLSLLPAMGLLSLLF